MCCENRSLLGLRARCTLLLEAGLSAEIRRPRAIYNLTDLLYVGQKSFINKAVVFVFSAFINTMAARKIGEMNQTIFQFTVTDINGIL